MVSYEDYVIDGKTVEDVYEESILEFFDQEKDLSVLDKDIVSTVCANFFFKAVKIGFSKVVVLEFIKEQVYGVS